MKSIKLRLVIMYIALVFIVMISSGTLMIYSIKSNEESSLREELKANANKIRENIINTYYLEDSGGSVYWEELPEYSEPPDEYFQRTMKSIAGSTQCEWNIIDAKTYKTIATTVTTDTLNMPSYRNAVIISALDGREEFMTDRKYDDINGRNRMWMEFASPYVNSAGDIEFVIYVRIDEQSLMNSISRTISIIVMSMIMAMALSATIGILFASTLTGPIIALTRKVKELAHSNNYLEIEAASNDEIGQLTESFNNMAKELSRSMQTMENEKNKLEILLYNITDGVLAYDNNGLLIHANAVAKELLNLDNIDSMSISEMMEILSPGDCDFMDEIVNNFTIALGEKYLELSLNPYRNKNGRVEGIVIVLQDITRHKRLDNMRKEFVANVSHEMRTPLTTIKSYTETLIDGAIDDREVTGDFLNVINGEVDRMTLLVKDLLELSSLDNNQLELKIQNVSLKELLRQTVKQNILIAEKLKKQLVFDEPDSDMIMDIDPSRIEQVFGNIISNAIKYSYEGSIIKVFVKEDEKYYKVFVRDNGIGIPKEDLMRVFERFYRVDKARSRALGGTGLGLSIAQEIMNAHGGKISASSELGKETTMILQFPK